MITKSKARGPGRLMRHLARADTNEIVMVGASRDVTPTLKDAMDELAARSATAVGRKSLFHVMANPEIGQQMDDGAWTAYWQAFEAEFALDKQPFMEVIHRKHGRDHRHRVYTLVRDDGRLVPTSHNYRRNELVSRRIEIALGQPLHPGRHHRWVTGELARRGLTEPSVGQTNAALLGPTFGQDEHQQAARTLAHGDPRLFRAAVYSLFVAAKGDWRQFAMGLDRQHMTVARGRSAFLVIDEQSRFHLPLARLLREEAKRAGSPIKIKSAELEIIFGRAKALEAELKVAQERLGQSRYVENGVLAREKPAKVAQVTSLANDLSVRMTMLRLLQAEQARRRRLSVAQEKRRRRSMDAKLLALADLACVRVAAMLIGKHRNRRIRLKHLIFIIKAIAIVNTLSPLILAAAAVLVVRAGQLSLQNASIRADVHAAKASRSGFRYADIPRESRKVYARLAASDLMVPNGHFADPMLVQIGPQAAARFVSWWAHASDRQRSVVLSWGVRSSGRRFTQGTATVAPRTQSRDRDR